MKTLLVLITSLFFLSGYVNAGEYDDLLGRTTEKAEPKKKQAASSSVVKKSVIKHDFTAFYPKADTRSQSPPKLSTLSVLCRAREGRLHLTFVGDRSNKVRLVLFTDKRVGNLSKIILLEKHFRTPKGGIPLATALAGPEGTLDWAYIYDRNKDGNIDYFAYLHNALAVKPANFQTIDWPVWKAKAGEKGASVTGRQIKYLFEHSRLVFNHFADDNFDGITDGVVGPIFDYNSYPWVDRFGVLRDNNFDNKIDETWTFKNSIHRKSGVVQKQGHKFVLEGTLFGKRLRSGKEWLDYGTKNFKIYNKHANKCGFTKNSFLH